MNQLMTPNGLRLQRIINTESYRFPEILASSYEQSVAPVVEFVVGLIDRAIAAGEVDPTNSRLAASAFTRTVVGGQAREIAHGYTPTLEELDENVRFSVHLLLDGLGPR